MRRAIVSFAVLLVAAAMAACSGSSNSDSGCSSAGGTCKALGDCSTTQGHLSPDTCVDFGTNVCCLPLSACPGPEIACCGATFTDRPYCEGGSYVCEDGTSPCDGGA
jgi:hypothetical protein